MAIGDIKTFNITYPGLTLKVTAIDLGNGQVSFEISCVSGSADINAIYWGDGDQVKDPGTMTGFDAKKDSALNMNGSGEVWDGGMKLSNPGLGPQGWNKPTALTAGESLNQVATLDFASLDTFGLRATSTSTSGGSIKGVDGDADVTPAPKVSVADAECVIEGSTATFTITLATPYPYDVYVTYGTSGGTAVQGADFSEASGVIMIAAGQTSVQVSVETTDDNLSEIIDEHFGLTLNSVRVDIPGSNDLISTTDFTADGSAEGCIEDNDPLEVSISDSCVVEGQFATFAVSLTTAAAYDVWVQFHTEGGTATQGADYIANSGWVMIAAGTTTAEIIIQTTDDSLDEGENTEAAAEHYSIVIDQVSVDVNDNGNDSGDVSQAGFILDGAGEGCIVDNDAPPPPPPAEDHFFDNGHGLSTATFYFNTTDGDIRGVLNGEPTNGRDGVNGPDGVYTVKVEFDGTGAGNDLDSYFGDIMDYIIETDANVDLSTVLLGVSIHAGMGRPEDTEIFYAIDGNPNDVDPVPSPPGDLAINNEVDASILYSEVEAWSA